MIGLICTLTLALALTSSSSFFLIPPVSPFSVKTTISSFYKKKLKGGGGWGGHLIYPEGLSCFLNELSAPPDCSALQVKYLAPYQSVFQKKMPQILQSIIMELSTTLKAKSCNLF